MLKDLAPSFGTNPPGDIFSLIFLFDRRSWSFWSKRLRKFRAHPLQPGILGLIVVGLMWGRRRNRWRSNKKHIWPLKELDLLESPLKFFWIDTREIQWRLVSNLWVAKSLWGGAANFLGRRSDLVQDWSKWDATPKSKFQTFFQSFYYDGSEKTVNAYSWCFN